jgi:N-acyl-D-amino-acid deacylase
MDFDIKITGGTIIDGTAAPRRSGDIGIKDGRITALGDVSGRATREIDARDRIVAPGFIDIHTHYDAQIIWDRMLSISPWHGVTTVVMGNCGFGIAPTKPDDRELIVRTLEKVEGMSADALHTGLGAEWPFGTFPEYLDVIEKTGTAINVGVLVGHTPIRLYVMGAEAAERPARADEVVKMREIVAEAMAAGAIGFATSTSPIHVGFEGRPVPSRFAEFDEILSLAGALKEMGRGVIQIAAGGDIRFDDYIALARESGATVSWAALLTRSSNPGLHLEHLARTAELIDAGLKIYPQISCRPLMNEFDFREPFAFGRLDMFQPLAQADNEGKKRIYRDAAFRASLEQTLSEAKTASIPIAELADAWEVAEFSYCPQRPELEGRRVADVAREAGTHSIDIALDLSVDSDFAVRFRIPAANADENGVEELLRDPNTHLGLSDAGAHASQLCDACYPTDLLGRWVREKEVLSLERAVHMMSGRPAHIFGLNDRGVLAPGRPADIVVFDPDTVAAGDLERVHDLPAGADRLISRPKGIDVVIVNGVVLRENDTDSLGPADVLPGRLLRHGGTANPAK